MAFEFTSFLSELKRRKVHSVDAVYAPVGVAMAVAVPDLSGALGAPDNPFAHGFRGRSLAGVGHMREARAEEGATKPGSLPGPYGRQPQRSSSPARTDLG